MARADDLLRALGAGVRPVGRDTGRRPDPDEPDFVHLLDGARAGVLRSGRSVALSPGLRLSEHQQRELDRAADEAETLAVGTLVAVSDRVVLEVDVPARLVTDARALRLGTDGEAPRVRQVGAVVVLPPSEEGDQAAALPSGGLAPGLRAGGPTRLGNPSLMRVLGAAGHTGE